MRRAARWAWLTLLVSAGCGGSGDPVGAAPSAAPAASSAASAGAPSASGLPAEPPPALVRRAEPRALAERDAADCKAGQAAACRRMADRHRGWGAVAGCGLDRGRPAPTSKRTTADGDADDAAFASFLGAACDAGDAEACAIEATLEHTVRWSTSLRGDLALGARFEQTALFRWQREGGNQTGSTLAAIAHAACLEGGRWRCEEAQNQLYARDSKPKDALPDTVAARALTLCRETLACSDMLMMLDKEGYPVEPVAKVRAQMAEVLVEACLDGACTCGEAAALLPESDARALDLARHGCAAGEVEGCYELGLRYEEGRGVPEDDARAAALFDVACPRVRPVEREGEPRQGDYSPRACDHLAAREEAPFPPRADGPAWYYARAACQRPGFERDHTTCMRLARYWANGERSGRNREDAYDFAHGPQSMPVHRKECRRPSVAAACERLDAELAARNL